MRRDILFAFTRIEQVKISIIIKNYVALPEKKPEILKFPYFTVVLDLDFDLSK